jgi:hypothetical protein
MGYLDLPLRENHEIAIGLPGWVRPFAHQLAGELGD